MIGQCRLFGREDDLRLSHIFPKFAIDYLKKTGSPYLRTSNNPNVRQQDGPKSYLLSHEAEQRFGVRENWFSKKIFKPYIEESEYSLPYDENMYYFAASFLWRVLIYHIEEVSDTQKAWYYNELLEVAENWRLFLKDFRYPKEHDRFYLLFTDRVKNHNIPHKGVDTYITRTMDATIVDNEAKSFLAVYGKFMRFVFWGIIKGGDEDKLEDLKIDPVKGVFNIPQSCTDPNTTGFYANRIEVIGNRPMPSEQQQKKILEEILRDRQGFLDSDVGKSILNDAIGRNSNNENGFTPS